MVPLRRILSFLRPYTRWATWALILLVLGVAAELAVPRLIQRLIDYGVTPRNMGVIVSTAAIMLAASFFDALTSLGNTLLAVRVAQYVGADLRSATFRKVETLSFGNLDRLQTGRLLVRLTNDVTQVQTIILMSMRIITRAPLLLIGSIILLVVTSWQLALIMLVLLPVTTVLIVAITGRAQPMFLQVQRRLDNLNTVLQENLAGVRVVKAFVRNDYETARFETANEALLSRTMRVMLLISTLGPLLMFCINLGTAAVIWLGGRQVMVGSLTIGAIMAFVNYLTATMFPMMMIGMMAGQISAASASSARILEILDSQPEVQERPDATALEPMRGRVAFEDVTFSYRGITGEPVLQHVSLEASPGERVAILGATGAGKSSLVSLIPRFYDVSSGRVTIDGRDVRDLTLSSLRSQVGVALQESVLFSGTIRDNIAYGRPDADAAEIETAARAAQAHDFIMSLPGGYNAEVGQRGVTLSGGQKQRLAIARALLIRPAILILDDSTSAVDVDTEARIEEAMEELMADRTSFVIAQRISTVLQADKIVVLDRGKVAAVGNHTSLMAESPIYREIYDSQLGDGGDNHD